MYMNAPYHVKFGQTHFQWLVVRLLEFAGILMILLVLPRKSIRFVCFSYCFRQFTQAAFNATVQQNCRDNIPTSIIMFRVLVILVCTIPLVASQGASASVSVSAVASGNSDAEAFGSAQAVSTNNTEAIAESIVTAVAEGNSSAVASGIAEAFGEDGAPAEAIANALAEAISSGGDDAAQAVADAFAEAEAGGQAEALAEAIAYALTETGQVAEAISSALARAVTDGGCPAIASSLSSAAAIAQQEGELDAFAGSLADSVAECLDLDSLAMAETIANAVASGEEDTITEVVLMVLTEGSADTLVTGLSAARNQGSACIGILFAIKVAVEELGSDLEGLQRAIAETPSINECLGRDTSQCLGTTERKCCERTGYPEECRCSVRGVCRASFNEEESLPEIGLYVYNDLRGLCRCPFT
eukprot:TRINITY_DN20106_c0_g1_i1.p1 TRINITY_DN20106_c0_g1~~TRINITY_DN20106_c0_g1_i1.p1  ORF type:complete len:415 (-),score=66.30 TRINITY_DN20106_c0_g1_i1:379-1623(-)